MVEFNELYINPNEGYLIVDASVKDLCYYNDVYLDELIIDTQDTYSPSGPSSTPVFKIKLDDYSSISSNDSICKSFNGLLPTEEEVLHGRKSFRYKLNIKDIKADNKLVFVYVKVKGIPSPDTPCGMDNIYTLGVTYDTKALYGKIIPLFKNKEDNKQALLDSLINLKAFNIYFDLGEFNRVIDIWESFSPESSTSVTSKCNCHA